MSMPQKNIQPDKPQARVPGCNLCRLAGETVVWRDTLCRVVLVSDSDYPGYCRVIWNSHIKEMTDLSSVHRTHCMRVVFAVEQVLRKLLCPHKINLASFGNLAPHLHWHVIPRFIRDAHFPNPVWGKRRRPRRAIAPMRSVAGLRKLIARQLATLL